MDYHRTHELHEGRPNAKSEIWFGFVYFVSLVVDCVFPFWFVGVTLFGDMKDDVRKLAHASPFVPFTIHLADGGQLRVPTVDHIAVPPAGGRVFVFGQDERYDVVSALMITRVVEGVEG